MSKKRRQHSPDLKARVGLEALKGIEPDLGFELGTMLTTFLRHGTGLVLDLTIPPVQFLGSTSHCTL